MTDFTAISYEAALRIILQAVEPLAAERVELNDAPGRSLAEDICADIDLPSFDNSAMDGYAVRAEHTSAASPERPVRLRIVGRVSAGAESFPPLEAGGALSIGTGAPIPPGADAVVRSEDVSLETEAVTLRAPVAAGHDIRRMGDDVRRGTRVLPPGRGLSAADVALLAALGRPSVAVTQRPRVAILATGDELALPGALLLPGQVYNANGPGLAAQVAEAGATPVLLEAAPDQLDATRELIEQGLSCDALVVSAGVSVGERDFVRHALSHFGAIQSWRLEMRPVRPFAFGRIGRTLVFGLPGNPVACLTGFELLVRPALRAMAAYTQIARPELLATLEESLDNPGGLLTFVRADLTWGAELTIRSAGGQATSNLATLARSNCLAVVPAGTTRVDAGTKVSVRLLTGNA